MFLAGCYFSGGVFPLLRGVERILGPLEWFLALSANPRIVVGPCRAGWWILVSPLTSSEDALLTSRVDEIL